MKINKEIREAYHIDEKDTVCITNELLDYFEEDESPYTARDFVEGIEANGEWKMLYKLYKDHFIGHSLILRCQKIKQNHLNNRLKDMNIIQG
jgi:bifunctional DNA-binding transcriptional regulator/antitoxin component of YhaV-PrlF toxin-antitoxin module